MVRTTTKEERKSKFYGCYSLSAKSSMLGKKEGWGKAEEKSREPVRMGSQWT